MKNLRHILVMVIIMLTSAFWGLDQFDGQQVKQIQEPSVQQVQIQLPFIANQGQAHDQVKFYTHSFRGSIFVTQNGDIIYSLPHYGESRGSEIKPQPSEMTGNFKSETSTKARSTHRIIGQEWVIRESLAGANQNAIKGEEPAQVKPNFYRGKDWQTGVAAFNIVSLGDVYDGIELKLRAFDRTVEKLFHVRPGARPSAIKIRLAGVTGIKIIESGELEAKSELGSVVFSQPIAYQVQDGKKQYVDVAYVCHDENNEYGFAVGAYDPERDLVIDPLLAATFLGGSGEDGFCYTDVNIAQGKDGAVYVAGKTLSPDFPHSTGVFQSNNAGVGDGFVVKLDRDLTQILAATFIGGSRREEIRALALDDQGNIYIAGITESSDYPIVASAYDPSYNGGATGPYGSGDVFISKFDNNLSTLLASTYLGGSSHESCSAMALDAQGNVIVTGGTASRQFPVTSGVFDDSFNPGGNWGYDIYLTKFSNNLALMLASTFLGGSQDDFSEALALDKNGKIYLAGWVSSANFPTTAGAYDRFYAGDTYDAFVACFDRDLTNLTASTFLGGNQWDFAYGLSLDANGDVWVTGHTAATGFPVTSNAFDRSYNGSGGQGVGDDVFVSKFNSQLSTLLASTYLGGSGWENGFALITDSKGNVYVTGTTSSSNFPTHANAYDKTYDGGTFSAGDIFITRLNNDLSTLSASTYLGKKGKESTAAIYQDPDGHILIAGSTASSDFPTTFGAVNENYNGGTGDVFIIRIDSLLSQQTVETGFRAQPQTGHAPLTVQFTDSSTGVQPITGWKWDFNHDGIYDSWQQNPLWTYNDPGVYSVLLEAANGSGSQKKLYRDWIRVFNGESALLFDGDKSKVTCPASAGLNLLVNLTIEAKINPIGWGKAQNAGFGRIVDKKNLALYLVGSSSSLNDHALALQLTHSDGTISISTSAENSISLNSWQQVAVTFSANSNEVKIYINGTEQMVSQGKAPSGTIADHGAVDLVIGNNAAQAFGFNGAIDEVRIWNRVRFKSEIQGHINQYLNGDETGLVGYWKMNEANGDTLNDQTAHRHQGLIDKANWVQGASLDLPTLVMPDLRANVATNFLLYPAFPNPFNPATTIRFYVPRVTPVSISIYSVTGQLLRTLFDAEREAGFYSLAWDGTDNAGKSVGSGVYFCRMVAGSFSSAMKLTLVK